MPSLNHLITTTTTSFSRDTFILMVSTHEQILTDDVTFKCELCEYSSKSKKGVNIHKSSKHKNKKNNKNTVISSSSPENGKESYFEEEAPINSEEKCDVCNRCTGKVR